MIDEINRLQDIIQKMGAETKRLGAFIDRQLETIETLELANKTLRRRVETLELDRAEPWP